MKPEEWAQLNEPQEIAREFTVDIRRFVLVNFETTMKGLDADETEELDTFGRVTDPDDRDNICRHISRDYADFRSAAKNLAIVGLITRFQHWIGSYARKRRFNLPRQPDESTLMWHLRVLNDRLGPGPVPLAFFDDMITIRDSVIHGDAQAKWPHGGKEREVAERYRDLYGNLSVDDEQFDEMVKNTTEQVLYYDGEIQKLNPKPAT